MRDVKIHGAVNDDTHLLRRTKATYEIVLHHSRINIINASKAMLPTRVGKVF